MCSSWLYWVPIGSRTSRIYKNQKNQQLYIISDSLWLAHNCLSFALFHTIISVFIYWNLFKPHKIHNSYLLHRSLFHMWFKWVSVFIWISEKKYLQISQHIINSFCTLRLILQVKWLVIMFFFKQNHPGYYFINSFRI